MSTTKDIREVEYLSKFVRPPTAEDSEHLRVLRSHRISQVLFRHKQLGLPTTSLNFDAFDDPKYVVYHSTPALWLRSTALRWFQAKGSQWREVSMARNSGHAANTAFDLSTWTSFAREWVEDANLLCAQHKVKMKWVVDSSSGDRHLPEVRQVNPLASSQALSPRQVAFVKWLKQVRYPSYLKVLSTHMDVKGMDPEAHDRLFGKINRGWRGPHEVFSEVVDGLQMFTDLIPDDFRKFTPSLPISYAERSFYTRNMRIERFVWNKLAESTPEDEISFSDFSSTINEGPYAAGTDPYGFYERRATDPAFAEQVRSTNRLLDQGLILLITVCYAITPLIENLVLSVWLVGPIYKLWMWSFFGLSKLYGFTNTLYWHAEAKSSREISRMMPKDPYLVSKRCCVFVSDLMPDWIGFFLVPFAIVLNTLPGILESVAKINYHGRVIKETPLNNMPQGNPWSSFADEAIDQVRASPTGFSVLVAPTGTGKTSYWPAAIYGARNTKNVRYLWVVSPYKFLRDSVSPPFDIEVQIMKKGVTDDPSVFVKSCTYGHFFHARLRDVDPVRDLVIYDEFHINTFEITACKVARRAPTFLVSATPLDDPALRGSPRFEPAIPKRFETKIFKYDNTMDVVDAYKLAEMSDEAGRHLRVPCPRALIIVPTHKQMMETIENMRNFLPSSAKIGPFSRLHRVPPSEGIIVATPYVDVGADIKPPPDVIINSGKTILIDRGVFQHPIPWTSAATNKQRNGRTGRLKDGYVYEPYAAGSGPSGVPYGSPSYLVHPLIARHYGLKPLGAAPRPACSTMPWLQFNDWPESNLTERRSVALLHSMAYAGVRERDWRKLYDQKLANKTLGEDFDFIDRTFNDRLWGDAELLPWDLAREHYNRPFITSTFFRLPDGTQEEKPGRPWMPVRQLWVQFEAAMDDIPNVDEAVTERLTTRWGELHSRIDNVSNVLIELTSKMSPAMRDFMHSRLYPDIG
jgi:hypothetical protein